MPAVLKSPDTAAIFDAFVAPVAAMLLAFVTVRPETDAMSPVLIAIWLVLAVMLFAFVTVNPETDAISPLAALL